MKKADKLYDFIQSLTTSEKGYFKKENKTFASKNYMLLYDIYCKMKAFDEATLTKKINNRFDLAQTKFYLENELLTTLSSIGIDPAYEKSINQLKIAKYLKNRNDFKEAMKWVKKAMNTANKNQDNSLLLHMMDLHCALHIKLGHYGTEGGIAISNKERTQNAKEVYMLAQLDELIGDIFELTRKEGVYLNRMTKDGKARFSVLASQFKNFKEIDVQTVFGKSQYLTITNLFRHIMQEPVELNGFVALVEEIIIDENFKRKAPDRLPYWLYNLLQHSLNQGNYAITAKYNEIAFLHLKENNGYEVYYNFLFHTLWINQFANLSNNMEVAVVLEKEIQFYLEKHFEIFNKKMRNALITQLIHNLFLAEEFALSHKWLNVLVSKCDVQEANEYTYRKMMEVLLLFEQDESELLPYKFRNFYRYLKKIKKPDKVELALLTFSKEILKSKANSSSEAIAKSYQLLIELLADAGNSSLLNHFSLQNWLKAKIEGKSYRSLYNKKRNIKVPDDLLSKMRF